MDRLSIRKTLDRIGGVMYLTELTDSVPTIHNAKAYAKIVQEKSIRREMIRVAYDIQKDAYDTDFDNVIDFKNNSLQKISDINISDSNSKKNNIKKLVKKAIENIKINMNRTEDNKLYTGFYDIDKITAGLHGSELTILAARPSVGKTAFALQLMLNLAKKDNHCLFISREMSEGQLINRVLTNWNNIDGNKIRTCKSLTDIDLSNMEKSADEIAELPIEINDVIDSVQEIRAYCRELKSKNKLDLLFIDYIGLLSTLKKCDSRRAEIEHISRQLKLMSKEFDIPIVTLCQLSRDNAKNGREPELFDLRESGSIEQDADNVIFLHVPEDTDMNAEKFNIKIIIGKQRNGATGFVYLQYIKKFMKFLNVSKDNMPNVPNMWKEK
jgi:replicative DNA helicase